MALIELCQLIALSFGINVARVGRHSSAIWEIITKIIYLFFFFITFESPLSSHWFRKPVRSIFCPQTKLPYLFYLNKSKICFLFYYEALKYWARSFQLSFNKFLGVFVFFVLFCCLFWLSWFEIKCCACDISEFAKLVEEFRSFGVKLMQSSSGLSHGTFEWVDSMLVRALKSGDWLLMDNVNFCK